MILIFWLLYRSIIAWPKIPMDSSSLLRIHVYDTYIHAVNTYVSTDGPTLNNCGGLALYSVVNAFATHLLVLHGLIVLYDCVNPAVIFSGLQ